MRTLCKVIQAYVMHIIRFKLTDYMMEEEFIPLELGIYLNKTYMEENSIKDIDISFKDPLNNVGFISSKVCTFNS